MPRRIVLIHGGSHGGWCWELVAPLLRRRGFAVEAPDLPGAGDDQTPPAEVTKAAYAARVIECLERGAEPALLVGHSMGGAAISLAAEQAPERVSGLVYLTAFLPRDGEASMADSGAFAPGTRSAARGMIPDPIAGLIHFDASQVTGIFYNRCDSEIAARAVARLRPQPMRPLEGAMRLTPQRWGRIPKSYIVCRYDEALPPETQRMLCDRAPGTRRIERDWDHSPFFSDPAGLAELLAEEAARY